LSAALFALCACAEDLPEGFYDKINGLKDGQLKDTLKSLIRDHTAISYGSSTWNVFYYSDRDENGYCMDMYCDEWYKFSSPGNAVTGCNIEHSFAKSWWGGAENDAYKDCYHLNPSNSTANSARSNYPLGVPETEIKLSGSLRVGKKHHPTMNVDHFVFEPKDEYKGDFARTYFYMVTCYENSLSSWTKGQEHTLDGNTYPGLQEWQLNMMMKWAKNDPVSEDKEIPRNIAVFGIQSNRNPFIDYPGLEEYIWGTMKEVAFSYDHYQNPTEIITVTAAPRYEDNVMYNMSGQVVDKSYKGLVIMNGKKFFNR